MDEKDKITGINDHIFEEIYDAAFAFVKEQMTKHDRLLPRHSACLVYAALHSAVQGLGDDAHIDFLEYVAENNLRSLDEKDAKNPMIYFDKTAA